MTSEGETSGTDSMQSFDVLAAQLSTVGGRCWAIRVHPVRCRPIGVVLDAESDMPGPQKIPNSDKETPGTQGAAEPARAWNVSSLGGKCEGCFSKHFRQMPSR